MMEKNEHSTDNDSNLDRIKLVADKRSFLEKQFLEVQEEIKLSFAHLAQALHAREKQLLRQSEAIYRQQVSLALSSQEVLAPSTITLDEINTLEEQIKRFGKIEFTGSNSTVITNLEPYKIEEYQDTDKDHVSFDKSIKCSETILSNAKLQFSSMMEDRKMQSVSNGLKTCSATNLAEKCSHVPDLPAKDSKEKIDQPSDTRLTEESFKKSKKNITDEHINYELRDQFQQLLNRMFKE